MPVTIKEAQIKYKDPNTSEYVPVAAVADYSSIDVQVNGTSVMNRGVANIPIASTTAPGAIRIGTGFTINDRTTLALNCAITAQIKNGASLLRPIVPYYQHESVFYGLAKAAGDVTQTSAFSPTGEYVYTPEAIVAIQKMLGIYEPPYELIRDITLSERTSVSITVDDNGLPFALRSVVMEIYYPENLVTESTGYGRYYFTDSTSSGRLCAETGRYTTNAQAMFKLIDLQRVANRSLVKFTRPTNVGAYGTWLTKPITYVDNRGMILNYGDITRIEMNSNDYEPAGTKIHVWGQRAY